MNDLWTKEKEIQFFYEARKFATPEQLFYIADDLRYYAYWPKTYKGQKSTLQSRNALIGSFTEKFCVDLLQDFAKANNLYAVQDVVCQNIALSPQSSADVALCRKSGREQNAEDILLIFEVKMSIVWNWELKNDELFCIGDFKTHKGNPGLLRSDSMLKAIGKGINIRISSNSASKIPIIILGNTPISQSYISKVDHLKKAGIIQGFWSINPEPLDDNGENIKNTPENGFIRFDSYNELENNLYGLLSEKHTFFSSMKPKKELGKLIEIADKENTYEAKAEKFLLLIRD